jgi:hypothetical protein
MSAQEVEAAKDRLLRYRSGDETVYEGLHNNNCYGTVAQEAFQKAINDRDSDMNILAESLLDSNAEQTYKYTYRFEEGNYYCYCGDCALHHRCSYLEDATYYDDPSDLKYYAAESKGGTVVKVKITYEEVVE